MNTKRDDHDMNDRKCGTCTKMADLLQEQHQDGDEGSSLLFQSEKRPRRSDKQLRETVRHVVLETMLGDNDLHSLLVRDHQVVWPGVLTRHFISAEHIGVERRNQRVYLKGHATDFIVYVKIKLWAVLLIQLYNVFQCLEKVCVADHEFLELDYSFKIKFL